MELDRRSFMKNSALFCGLMMAGQGRNILAEPASVPAPSATTPLYLNKTCNPQGLPPAARQAIIESLDGAYRYPEQEYESLIQTIARYHGVDTSSVVYGNGASDVLRSVVLALAEPGCQLVIPVPTYDVTVNYVRQLGYPVREIPLTDQLDIDLARMREEVDGHDGVSIVYLSNPNNPTGKLINEEALSAWISSAGRDVFFIIDEAHIDYVGDGHYRSALSYVTDNRQNLIVVRSFSKAYGLAGLRVGYGIAHPEVARRFAGWATEQPASLPGCVAAKAMLEDKSWLPATRKLNRETAAILCETLDQLELQYHPVNSNFIFHRIKTDHAIFQHQMQEAGIHVPAMYRNAEGWNRVSVGRPEEVARYCQLLHQFRASGWV